MKRFEINKLKECLAIQTESYNNKKMQQYIIEEAEEIGAKWRQDIYGNIYLTKGESSTYPCFVAHTDTVHMMVPKNSFKIYELNNTLFSIDARDFQRCGIGGDDKVGVYIALRMLRELDVAKAAFFVDEEVGCLGSKDCDTGFFEDVNVAMQADRRGVREITESIMGLEMYGDEFRKDIHDIILEHNFMEVDGGMTDVWAVGKQVKSVPMFNVACGYYRPHTSGEYVNWMDVEDTFRFLAEVELATRGKNYSGNWKRDYTQGSWYTKNNGWKKSYKSSKKTKTKTSVRQYGKDGLMNTNLLSCEYCRMYPAEFEVDDNGYVWCEGCGAFMGKES